ncbi:MAG: cytochrome c nitrite reductase small subunit, partial [Bacteroidales bacterium]|nr:cytochrome c nitrite reductase small subunit [Bacteroidales bacterium]
ENCIRCHVNTLEDAKINTIDRDFYSRRTGRQCWDCHRDVPHGRVNSLQSVPNARVPLPESPVPDWLINRLNRN